MKSTLRKAPRRRLPVRRCGLCGRSVDVLHLGRMGRLRICADCHDAQGKGSSASEDGDRSGALAQMRRIDACFRAAAVIARMLLYLGLYQLVRHTDFGSPLVTGFLLADGVTWLAAAWLERRFHGLEILVETLLYTTALVLWFALTGGLQLPSDAAGRAIMWLSFLGTFSLKGGFQAWRLLHGGGRP